MNSKSLIPLAVVALLLYWIVQAPIGAADFIHSAWTWSIHLTQLIADRVVAFLDALF